MAGHMSGLSWMLLVEDDAIFATLFSRSWKKIYPECEIRIARSLAEARAVLGESASDPKIVVVDRILPDGNGSTLLDSSSGRSLCWSAEGGHGFKIKPRGKLELEMAIRSLFDWERL